MFTFIWRKPNGQIEYIKSNSADESLNKFGIRLSWDDCMNSVDVKTPSGKVQKFVLTGVR